jgi:serine phosphatase RsbU (regulator of sigma subunit)
MAYTLGNIAEVYRKQAMMKPATDPGRKRLEELALETTLRTLDLHKTSGEKRGEALAMAHICISLTSLNRVQEAIPYGEKSLSIAQEIGYPDNIRRASGALSDAYVKAGNWKAAYQMQVLYKTMSDSLTNEKNRKASIQKRFEYEYERKAVADSVRTAQERKVFSAQLQEERTKRNALYLGIALAGIFGITMFNRFKVTKKQNRLINQQKSELQVQKELVEQHQKETLDSIHYAKRIQNALISNSDLISGRLADSFILFKPKDIVSGDFYWATNRGSIFYLAICDSTGHGVPGAFMSLLNMGFLSEAIKEKNISDPARVFDYVRERLISSISEAGQRDGMDGILLQVSEGSDVLKYVAANNSPILIRDGRIIDLPKDKMPVGSGEKMNAFTTHSFTVQKGDTLFLYTDGFADQFGGPDGKKFKYRRLNELLVSISNDSAEAQKDRLQNEFEKWKGNLEQVDDVCIAGIRF